MLMAALQTERHLYDILHKHIVMKDENDKKLREWYYSIQEILTAVESTRALLKILRKHSISSVTR